MFRWAVLFILLPFAANADWAPRPSLFGYAAAFDLCTADPTADDLAASCAQRLAAAYVLKRAVAEAAYACATTPLADCPAPFEDAGLPAIAAWIADDMGCDGTPVAGLARDEPFPPDHCVSITADIMGDEGVVPLENEVTCAEDGVECQELAMLHALLWMDAVDAISDSDATIDDLQARNVNLCLAETTAIGPAAEIEAMTCIADRASALWADLAEQD